METALTVIEPASLPAELLEPLRMAADFARASKSPATLAAYGNDMLVYSRWCEQRGLAPMPITPAAVCAFLADEAAAGRKSSTISRRVAALKHFAKAAGDKTSPTDDERVKATLSGIRRAIGTAPVRKRAAVAELVIAMASKAETPRQQRDRAILLAGFAGAFRRSELVGLDVEDVEETPEGMLLHIKRGKVDQEGKGRKVAIARGAIACPCEALKAWMAQVGSTGPLFRNFRTGERLSGRQVASVVKREAKRLGMNPREWGGHSLRAGFVTSAIRRGANLVKITAVTGHASIQMLQTYHRDVDAFKDHAGAGLL